MKQDYFEIDRVIEDLSQILCETHVLPVGLRLTISRIHRKKSIGKK